jgi:hypothetical protein
MLAHGVFPVEIIFFWLPNFLFSNFFTMVSLEQELRYTIVIFFKLFEQFLIFKVNFFYLSFAAVLFQNIFDLLFLFILK